jgi:hypothetical protein
MRGEHQQIKLRRQMHGGRQPNLQAARPGEPPQVVKTGAEMKMSGEAHRNPGAPSPAQRHQPMSGEQHSKHNKLSTMNRQRTLVLTRHGPARWWEPALARHPSPWAEQTGLILSRYKRECGKPFPCKTQVYNLPSQSRRSLPAKCMKCLFRNAWQCSERWKPRVEQQLRPRGRHQLPHQLRLWRKYRQPNH